ncbi:MAG: nucleotidyl transferase AbiEii/AbiGii toxin family protein [Chloroflexi bacterium]|nr:nucleotidyl transferase AbiEii/AbiGii toxin family protein [Chloroflexota bacterium]
MKKPVTNVPASILARLKNQAEILDRPFAEILQYYAMERFLYRLSKTKYAAKFVLKGGLLFYVWNVPLRRPTKDIDFRGYVSNDSQRLLEIFREVAAVSTPEDGLVFDLDSIAIDETQMDADYQGIRVKLNVTLARSRIPVQIDIGFSDELTSKAELVEYPNILSDLQHIRMKGYPKESVVAEKFHAMIRHGDLNSRMKDYYDIWLISGAFEFEGQSLRKAIETTFKNRDASLPIERPESRSVEFASASSTRWKTFLEKANLETADSADFTRIIEDVWGFLEYPLRASISQTKSARKWIPQRGWL